MNRHTLATTLVVIALVVSVGGVAVAGIGGGAATGIDDDTVAGVGDVTVSDIGDDTVAGVGGVDVSDVGAAPSDSFEKRNAATTLADENDGIQIAEGSPDPRVELFDNQVPEGQSETLELRVTNDASPDEDHPDGIGDRVVTAEDLTVALFVLEGPLEVTSDPVDVGDLGPGESAEVTFEITVGDLDDYEDEQDRFGRADEQADTAADHQYDVEVELSYDDVEAVTYDADGEILSEERSDRTETVVLTILVEPHEYGLLWYLFWLSPLVLPAGIVFAWLSGKQSSRVEGVLNRFSRILFGRFVSSDSERERRIEAAFIETTYRTYAAKSYLLAVLGFVAGAIAGAYLIAGFLATLEPLVHALAGLPRTITRPIGIHPEFEFEIATRTRWLVLLSGGLVSGMLVGVLAYVARWSLPTNTAAVRKRGIDEGLARTTAFMYALSRGGMEFPQIVRILTDHRDVYGETANEMSVAVREMDLFGRDMITALRRMSHRTPSEQFKTFSENLTSVLQSGSDLSTFFSEQYERFHDEAEERQEDVLELLATIAEAYVTILVAGMLFFITILLVFGLTVTDTMWILQLVIYVMIPLANAGFALFLQQQLDILGIGKQGIGDAIERMEAATPVNATPRRQSTHDSRDATPDGGLTHQREQETRQMLALHDRIEWLKQALGNPLEIVLWNPTKLLWVTVPLALLWIGYHAPAAFQAEGVNIRMLDDVLIQATLFVLATYALVRFVYKRRIERIESATPELLERLASLNEAGMSVVDGLDRIRDSDLGILSPEVERIWRDIEYGATVDDAFVRFGRRVRTTAITRVVTLLTNAMRASGKMGPVLRVASEQARSEVKLRRQRRQKMLTYLVVIYVSFFVFLVIILAVNEVLVPSLPDTTPTPEGGEADRLGASPDALARFGAVNQAEYTLIFFHAALIQAVCAGFIGGQLGEGSLRDGAKHAAIMLGVAYIGFVLLTTPIASITLDSQQVDTGEEIIVYDAVSDGDVLTEIEEVTVSEGGFVAVYDHEEGINGTLYGHTEYLAPGTHTDIDIPLQREITETKQVRLVVHRDTNDNERFDFEQPFRPNENQVDRPYDTPTENDEPGIEITVLY